jgi:chemotaxis protein CheD
VATQFRSTYLPQAEFAAPVELMPGDVALGLAGDAFKTLLGSCICVVLTDPRRTVGALCHIVHVGTPNANNVGNTAYGVVAMERMFSFLRSKGVNPVMCEAFVYGGGNMFPQFFSARHVGGTNAEWVLDFLHDHGIPVVEQETGGTGYRKLTWSVGPQDPLVETVFAEQGVRHGD